MILSERGAIASAIAGGGFHLYPAGRLIEMVKKELEEDDLCGNFDPKGTAEKIAQIRGPKDPAAGSIFKKDLALLCERLSKIAPEYDIEAVFDKMQAAVPAMARRYYGLENFEAPRPQVLEYFFEGYNDLYKDGDWFAFNVNRSESVELGVPIGTYFKRNQISPGLPEFSVFHEANHAMQDLCYLHEGINHYIPWMDEGLADIFGRIMLFRATGDESIITKVKTLKCEVEVTDPRKVTYHYGEETMALMLLRGRLPFVRALMQARKREPFAIDWNLLAGKTKLGWDPHIAIVSAYTGRNADAFRKRVERDETKFRKEADLDQQDLRIIQMFLASEPPASLPADEYSAALWLADEIARSAGPNSELSIKSVIKVEDVPGEYREGAERLAAKYFIIKKQAGESTVYEPYGGGLPYRLCTGELRTSY